VNPISDIILHGTCWIKHESSEPGWFLIWGEQKYPEVLTKPRGRRPRILRHPYAASSGAMREMLRALSESLMLDGFELDVSEGEAVLTLPVIGRTPVPSRQTVTELDGKPGMADCRIDAVYLSTSDALEFLSAIPLHTHDLPCRLGADIRFWSAAAKFAFHLISQHKFIPMLREEAEDGFAAFWEPVLDDPSDVEKMEKLIRMMPDACRSVKSATSVRDSAKLTELHPRQLILGFLNDSVDIYVRSHAGQSLMSGIPRGVNDKAVIRWLKALTEPVGTFQALDLETGLRHLCTSLAGWRDAGIVSRDRPEKFRTCFRLEPPEDGDSNWALRYFLQAVDDPSLLIPADVVWRERGATLRYLNRELESPQERLLAGLGMAARMFPPVERSLRQARPDICFLSVGEAYQFLSEASLLLQQSGFGVLAPPWWTDRRSQLKAKVSVSPPKTASVGFLSLDTIVQYDWELALGDEVITPEELEHLARLKVPLVQMRGQWVMLRPEDIQAAMEFFKKHGESREMSLRDTVRLSLDESAELEGIQVDAVECPDWLGSLVGDLKSGKLRQLRQPKEFVGALRPYQLRGLSWLAFMRQWGLGACLADDMGLGKTIQVIVFLLRERKLRKSKSRPNLLICPTSVVGNWQREVDRFAPSLDVMVHHGSDRLAGEEFAESIMEHDLVVTSYGLARRDADDLAAADWKGVILDEAQNIKNPSSKTAQAVRSLNAQYRFALTGTPVENRLMELWSIMEFLNPGYLWSQKRFQERCVVPIERYDDEKATAELKSLVAPFILRRLKTDPKVISDLPEKMEIKIYCNLTKEQVTLYEAVVKDMMQEFEEDDEMGKIPHTPGGTAEMSRMQRRGKILSGLMKLKQLCNHPALFLHDHSELEGRSGKLQRLVEMLEEVLAEEDKALIFTQFTEMGDALQEYLASKFRCDILYLHGSVPQKKRDRLVSLFQGSSNGPPLFIVSIRAGGTGLNLTRANHVFHFDRWWNPAVEDQATDRTFRIGQTRKVQVHKFICAGTFEEQIDQLIERKKALAESIIGAGENWITELSNAELRKMITLRRDDALSADER
jgi:SNF2 family DNA or RNA helicase